MSSEVDICNLALAHLGDSATVASINPPERSAQAAHCARFYPMARDSLLERHPWGFATVRSGLAGLTLETATTGWAYSYAIPNGVLKVLAVLAPGSTDDYTAVLGYAPQPYVRETQADGTEIILTNQADAVLRYTQRVTDTAKFSPLFVDCLSWLLTSYLAGPIMKGDTGAAAARAAYTTFRGLFGDAIESDSNQRRVSPSHSVAWMSARA